MDRLLDLTAGLSLVLGALVLASIRRAHIRVEYSISWLAGALALFAVSRSPALLERAAGWIGLADAPLALVLVAGCLLLVILFRFSVIISQLKDDNIALAQRVAILEFHLQSLQAQSRIPE